MSLPDTARVDSITFSLEEARDLIRINEDRKTCEKVTDQLNLKVKNLGRQIDLKDEKIGLFVMNEDKYKATIKAQDQKIKVLDETIEDLRKKSKRKLIAGGFGAAILLALSILI